MNSWRKLNNCERMSEITRWVERFRDPIVALINESDDHLHKFNYVVDCEDFNAIALYDMGERFASIDLDMVDGPAVLMEVIMHIIDVQYYDSVDPEEIEEAYETLKANRRRAQHE